MNQHQQQHNQQYQQFCNINNNLCSPKKSIIQKYNEDIDDMVIKTYTSRLVLTWIYNNNQPPILSAIPKLKVIPGSMVSKQFSNCTLSTSTHTFTEIECYVREIFDLWETVISFFYTQHIKRSKAYYQNVKQSPNNTESEQSVKSTLKSIIIGSIYYSDLFFRKSSIAMANSSKQSKFTILDIIISSINLSIKMWLEEKMSVNKYLSEIFGVSLVHVNSLERYFLHLIDYQLYLHEKDIQSFSNIIHKSYVNKSTTTTINSNNSNNNIISKPIIENENCAVYNNNNYSQQQQQYIQHDSVNSSPLPCSTTGNTIHSSYGGSYYNGESSSSVASPSVLVVPCSPIKSFIQQQQQQQQQQQHQSQSLTSPLNSINNSPKKRYLSISRSSSSSFNNNLNSSSSSNTNTPITTSSPSTTCTVPNSIHHDDYQDLPKKRIKILASE